MKNGIECLHERMNEMKYWKEEIERRKESRKEGRDERYFERACITVMYSVYLGTLNYCKNLCFAFVSIFAHSP